MQCVHSTPGRLRLRCPLFKDEQGAGAVQQLLLSSAGVTSARLNTAAGSLLICFDPLRVSHQSITAMLAREGHSVAGISSQAPERHRVRSRGYAMISGSGKYIARRACQAAGERLIEYLIAAAIASVL